MFGEVGVVATVSLVLLYVGGGGAMVLVVFVPWWWAGGGGGTMVGPCGFLFMRASPDWGNIAHWRCMLAAPTRPQLPSTVAALNTVQYSMMVG